jgi:Signal transduction histidine kinase involved in nitrogen fixation and metabolism regulation
MTSGNFRLGTVVRVAVAMLLIAFFLLTLLKTNWVVTSVILFLAICLAVYELIRYTEETNYSISSFLLSIRSGDFSKYETADNRGRSFAQLKEAYNTIIDEFQVARTEREAQYVFLQSIISHVSTAIICFDDDGKIKLLNNTAAQLLHIPELNDIRYLQKSHPELLQHILNSTNELIEINTKEEKLKLLLRATSFKLQGHGHKLVLITNVKGEIDRAETEAWQQQLQVLTHEIMNSITPISSLSDTIKSEFDQMVQQRNFQDEQLNELSEGLSVIKNRSIGLIDFVHHYKSFINLPTPTLRTVSVATLLENIQTLTTQYLEGKGIRLIILSPLRPLNIMADERLIEQVALNLLNNAADALQNIESPTITLSTEERDDIVMLNITDNGTGIEKDIQDKIFIPFFTTKINGTGVGLSLSKQIMHLHKGNMAVHSTPGAGTTFSLIFQKA